jgi:hypothetical protein
MAITLNLPSDTTDATKTTKAQTKLPQ